MEGTRYFKVPRFAKYAIFVTGLVVVLTLIGSTLLLFSQHDELKQTRARTSTLEDNFVKLSSKNSSLNKSLELQSRETQRLSEILTQMEQSSGISSGINSGIVDRLSAVSDYVSSEEGQCEEAGENSTAQNIAPEASGENLRTTEQTYTEPANLSISQQKILHDSVPNGYPTRNIGVNSHFGKRVHPTNKQSSFHNGIDLKTSDRAEVYATADGVIKNAAYNKLNGKQIVISHNLGFESYYADLSEMKVKSGDVVQKGDLIALSGRSGLTGSPQLHYEVRYLDEAYNPIDFIKWEFGSQEIFTKTRGIQWQSLISLINKQISRPTLQLSQLAPESKAK